MNRPHSDHLRSVTRRHFFADCGVGVGKIALAGLLADRSARAASARDDRVLPPRAPHFRARAQAVIQLFMAGAPSQLEMFEHKPKPAAIEANAIPPEVIGDQRRLKLILIECEEWLGAGTPALLAAGNSASVFLAGRNLELREPLEAERLREAHNRRAGGVSSTRELLGGLGHGQVAVGVHEGLPEHVLELATRRAEPQRLTPPGASEHVRRLAHRLGAAHEHGLLGNIGVHQQLRAQVHAARLVEPQ